ncbi:MAG: chemotaxis protein MotB [Rhodobiaceae bacterium]|nr:MAG: chemotaxis protein MotB [Rhodobiaceae bacterium]
MATNPDQAIIIKRVKKGGHPHHGGAWKIAYADFVTAMMAFFLLMWLLAMTTPEQKQGLADYFAPANISRSSSGAGGVMGGTAFDVDGARMAGSAPKVMMTIATPAAPKSPETENQRTAETSDGMESADGDAPGTTEFEDSPDSSVQSNSGSNDAFQSAAESLRQSMQDMPEIAELSRNIIIEETPEGLNIQLTDQDGRSMFPPGHAEPYERTRLVIEQISLVIQKLPNRVIITGHTDANPLENTPGYSNWELTADRANATRRILQEKGLRADQIAQVSGKADTEPLFPEDPYLPANRRIGILLLNEAPVVPPGFAP